MSETSKRGPEHLLPHHIGGELPQPQSGLAPEKRRERRAEALYEAPQFEEQITKELQERGIEVPENLNLSVLGVEEFQRLVREAEALRTVVRHAGEQGEREQALTMYGKKQRSIGEYLGHGLSFERAYREYIQARNEYVRFCLAQKEAGKLDELLFEPAFQSLSPDAPLDEVALARLESMAREQTSAVTTDQAEERTSLLESLKTIFPEDSEEYKTQAALIMEEHGAAPFPKTKKEIMEEVASLQKSIQALWEVNMVRYFWKKHEMEKILKDFSKGEDVIETQSVIKNLNKLHEWETQHQRTTIGGVLVGPPGVGKTTLVRHYLEEKGRNYAYIDLSEDVTRYLLYGSKSIEFKSPAEYYKALLHDLEGMDEESFTRFIQKNAEQLKQTFQATDQEAVTLVITQLQEEIAKGGALLEDTREQSKRVAENVTRLAEQGFHQELASQFAHLVKRNGWRDGIIIAALRRGDSVILDEFDKNKNWTLLYSLLTAKPGEEWYFADNDERIAIPDHWRMYFTANIGRRHGGFEVAEALASRAAGKVMDVDYPPVQEETQIALAALSDAQGDFLRPKEDLAKLAILLREAFPKIRDFTEEKRQAIPLSYRTLRDIGEKLVLLRSPESNTPVFARTNHSFDQAVYEVLVESYAVYEDKTIPKEIVNLLTSAGLLFDDAIQDKVAQWIGEDTYNERKAIFAGHQEDFEDIVKKFRGMDAASLEALAVPQRKQL